MKINLAYGKTGLELELTDTWNVQVVEPRYVPGLVDPQKSLQDALRHPIGAEALVKLVQPGSHVGIIVNDITRATPTPLILRTLINELVGVPHENIIIFIALGTHRPNTPQELDHMLGPDISRSYKIIQNNAFDRTTQNHLGQTSQGHDILINRALMDCEVKILTGFIEPHFFAGFSGAGKAVMPGMAGLETVLGNHSAQNIAHPNATWGITWGNPIWEEVHEVALLIKPTFLVNVTLNRDKAITAVFAGDLDQAYTQGINFVRQTSMIAVDHPFDIVVTTNSGYPLDLNLYQAVKGMSAAAQIVRPGGAIVIAAECWDGIPEQGMYGQLLKNSSNPTTLLEMIMQSGFSKQDQWQAQIQAQIQLKADVYVYSSYLHPDQIRSALLKPAESIGSVLDCLVKQYGKGASICVLPEGPQTIPYIAQHEITT
jgi:nickel-dependent lactate racemase